MQINYNDLLPTEFRSDDYQDNLFDFLVTVRYVLFQLTIISFYILYRIIFTGKLNWEHNKLKINGEYDQALNLFVYSTSLFALGNYGGTLNILTLILIPFGGIGFGALGELPFLKNDITNFFKDPKAIPVYLSAIIVILGLVGYHIFEAVYYGIWIWYLIGLVIWILFFIIGVVIWAIRGKKDNFGLHPHHWAIFLSLAIFTRFPTIISNISGGICIGIFVQGAASFGIGSSIF